MVELSELKTAVILILLIAMVGSAVSIAISEFQDQQDNAAAITINNESLVFTAANNNTAIALAHGGRSVTCNRIYNYTNLTADNIIDSSRYSCATNGVTLNDTNITAGTIYVNYTYEEFSQAQNISEDGLVGIGNTTEFLGTIGTIIAVMALVGIVVAAFAFGKR